MFPPWSVSARRVCSDVPLHCPDAAAPAADSEIVALQLVCLKPVAEMSSMTEYTHNKEGDIKRLTSISK